MRRKRWPRFAAFFGPADARIWEAWRDGYADSIAEHAGVSREEIERRFREMIACVRDPRGYALWQVPLWTAVRA